MSKLIFVNLPVADLERAAAFYEAIGAVKNERFCDGTASCMVLSETIHVMLLTHDKFRQFTPKRIADAHQTSEVLLCISAESRDDVDRTVEKAGPAGRRKMLDAAREKAGFETTKAIEFREQFEQDQRNARARAAGAPPPRFAYNESGLIVDLAEIEQDRQRAAAQQESLRLQREDRAAVRAVEAAAMREHEEARAAAFRSELPPGFA